MQGGSTFQVIFMVSCQNIFVQSKRGRGYVDFMRWSCVDASGTGSVHINK